MGSNPTLLNFYFLRDDINSMYSSTNAALFMINGEMMVRARKQVASNARHSHSPKYNLNYLKGFLPRRIILLASLSIALYECTIVGCASSRQPSASPPSTMSNAEEAGWLSCARDSPDGQGEVDGLILVLLAEADDL